MLLTLDWKSGRRAREKAPLKFRNSILAMLVCSSFHKYWKETLAKKTRFTLVHSSQGFSPQLLVPSTVGLWWTRAALREAERWEGTETRFLSKSCPQLPPSSNQPSPSLTSSSSNTTSYQSICGWIHPLE